VDKKMLGLLSIAKLNVKTLQHFICCNVYIVVFVITIIISQSTSAGEKTLPYPSPVRPKIEFSSDQRSDRALGSYLAGTYALTKNDQLLASKYLSNALEVNPNNTQLLKNSINAFVAIGDIESAVPLASRLILSKPNNNFARLVLIVDFLANQKIDDAKYQISKLSLEGIYGLLGPLLSAWAEYGNENVNVAISAMESLKTKKIYQPYFSFHSAMINDLSENVIDAEKLYLKTAQTSVGQTNRWILIYGDFLTRNNRQDEAIKLYKSWLESDPNSSWLEQVLTKTHHSKDNTQEIRGYRDGIAEVFYGIASLLPQSAGHANALIYTRLALHLRKDFAAAYILLGEIYESLGQFKEAISEYEKVSQESIFLWTAKLRKSQKLAELKNLDEAMDILRPMVEEQPKRTDAPEVLGDILRFAEHHTEAIKAYDIAIDRVSVFRSDHWRLLYSRGVSLEQTKNWERAEKDFLKALNLSPSQPLVLNYLGYSWLEMEINLNRAKTMIEEAVKLRPNDGYIVDSLGWAYYRLGDFNNAIHFLERALELIPNDPIINDHLGDAFWETGRFIEARYQWNRAITLGASGDYVKAIKEKLGRDFKVYDHNLGNGS
tara:strand:- start:6412 stop:8223 length:1812 start_codon:yes stop_codon:yes gene_type:complete